MAQPIHCDATDCPELASVLISRIANGPAETTAWCDPHYLEVARSIADAVAQAEADQAAAEASARLEAAGPDPSGSDGSSDGAPAGPGEPGPPGDGPQPSGLDVEAPPTETAVLGRPRRAGRAKAGTTAEA